MRSAGWPRRVTTTARSALIFWRRTLSERKIEDDDLDQAIRLMKKHNAIEATLERARHYGGIARDALAIFPSGIHTRALGDVIGFCVSRSS